MDQDEIAENSDSENRGSPLPGCVILCMIILVFGGLLVLYTVIGYTQNKKIDEFTESVAATIPAASPLPEQIAAAKKKLSAIKAAVSQNKSERFLFTAEDLNTLIASMEVAKDFRGQTFVKEITEAGILAQMAQPMRKGIFEKGFRYLNGTFLFKPELRAQTIAFRVENIQPNKGAVPKAFIGGFAGIDFFKLDPKNEVLAAHVRSLKRVYTEKEHLVVQTQIVAGK